MFRIVLSLLLALPLTAEVVRVEIQTHEDVAAWGYERLIGKVYYAVDPGNAANRIIVDLDKAAKNAAGKVEFSADLYVLKPKRPNGAALMEVSNRGGRGTVRFFD